MTKEFLYHPYIRSHQSFPHLPLTSPPAATRILSLSLRIRWDINYLSSSQTIIPLSFPISTLQPLNLALWQPPATLRLDLHNLSRGVTAAAFQQTAITANLSPGTSSQQLKDFFHAAGIVNRCDILEQRPFGRTKVSAAIDFQNQEEAKRAIAMFDGSTFMGSRIRVRFNRERSRSSSSQPKQAAFAGSRVVQEANTTEMTGAYDRLDTTAVGSGGLKQEETNLGKRRGEPLVVNGSCLGMKTGQGAEEKRDYEGAFISLLLVDEAGPNCYGHR
ncbi:hypothetical protein PRK78_004238 [Emydomyces testavorans]|uniref:RRM domain-containing protein n=1 Tax=Emydomyces testavorans TaxID=2070801 RepID=A0AAF0DHS1_9EURO|nr:hypothetical protein PRK78_004238 [Emydomyces testavorans]